MKSYNNYIQESQDNSGIFSVNIDGENMIFSLKYSDKIYIMLDSEIYQELSVNIPASKFLEESEFFLNPDVDKRIVDVLIDENFIEKTDMESIAGDKKTYSYTIV